MTLTRNEGNRRSISRRHGLRRRNAWTTYREKDIFDGGKSARNGHRLDIQSRIKNGQAEITPEIPQEIPQEIPAIPEIPALPAINLPVLDKSATPSSNLSADGYKDLESITNACHHSNNGDFCIACFYKYVDLKAFADDSLWENELKKLTFKGVNPHFLRHLDHQYYSSNEYRHKVDMFQRIHNMHVILPYQEGITEDESETEGEEDLWDENEGTIDNPINLC
jgi:hypothetical protein